MSPALRLSFSLVLSLLLWLPTVPSALAASHDPTTIAVRYLVALLVSRLGVGLVFRVVGGYAGNVLAEMEAETPDEAPTPPEKSQVVDDRSRRREDQDTAAEGEEPEALLDEALDEARDVATLVP